MLGSLCLALPGAIVGAEWSTGASLTTTVSATDNVNLAPAGQEQSDVSLLVTPSISVSGTGGRLRFTATYTPTLVFHSDDTLSNQWYNRLSANGNLEAIENFFFVEARASVSQQFLSPFGARPADLQSETANRTESWAVGVSPYIRGVFPGGTTYLVRNDSTWTNTSGVNFGNAYYANNVARLENTVRRIGWSLEYNGTYLKYADDESSLTSDLGRARLIFQVDPQFTAYVSGGYETNNYGLRNYAAATYGGGLIWRPTDRTNVVANYEYRFFGNSYVVSFDHRTRLTAWSLSAARGISNYATQAFTLPPGNTAALLNAIFAARIPDPAARQAAVQQFINQTGLPPFLFGPQEFYTQQVFVQQPIYASFAILGVRNTIVFTAFRIYNQRYTGGGTPVPDAFNTANEFTEYGAGVSWGYRLTPLTTLNFSAVRTETDAEAPNPSESTQNILGLSLSTSLSPKTGAAVGVRYTDFNSNVANDYRQTTVFGTISHRF